MSTKIGPALSAEEWMVLRVSYGNGDALAEQDCGGHGYHVNPDGKLCYEIGYEGCDRTEGIQRPEAMIALANAALPDDDQRKITRATIGMLRETAESDQAAYDNFAALRQLADALASYLPPR